MQGQLPQGSWGPDEYQNHSKGQHAFQISPEFRQVAAFFLASCALFAVVIFAAMNLQLPYITAIVIVAVIFAAFGALVWRTATGTLQKS
jgi:hypothetical protein